MYNKWKLIQIWILYSWSFLTIGILLGSWWAYHELGWGGWWFWDPVENASLMPWLIATSCLHSITKVKLNSWTLFYVQITFFLSILGTFFVRSGFLGSVHSFATDSTRGVFLLVFLLFLIFFSLLEWLYPSLNQFNFSPFRTKPTQVSLLKKKAVTFQYSHSFCLNGQDSGISKKRHYFKKFVDTLVLLQGFYFCLICLIVLCGTTAPLLFFLLWGRDVGTGAPFYNGTLIPLFSSLFVLLAFLHYYPYFKINPTKLDFFAKTPLKFFEKFWLRTFQIFQTDYLPPRKDQIFKNINSLYLITLCYFFLHTVVLYFILGLNFLCSIYGSLCFLIFSSFFLRKKKVFSFTSWPLLEAVLSIPSRYTNITSNFAKIKQRQNSIEKVRAVYENQIEKNSQNLFVVNQKESTKHSNSQLEMKVAHLGLVLLLAGILFSNTLKFQLTQLLQPGSIIRIGGQVCCLRSIDHSFAPTFQSICANLVVYPSSKASNFPDFGLDFKENFFIFVKNKFLWNDFLEDKQFSIKPKNWKEYSGSPESYWWQENLSYSNLSMFPEKRFYYSSINTSTTKVAIHSNFVTDFYSLIGTGSLDIGWFTTIMKLPSIFSIWLGFVFGVFGGFLSLRKQLKKPKVQWL